jgi:CRP/FNR family transcriptional regulator, cyclic AMP receptor protein
MHGVDDDQPRIDPLSVTRHKSVADLPAALRPYADAILNSLWFRSLPDTMRIRLLEVANVRRLEAGQRLFAKGESPDGLYCVVEGALRVTTTREDGAETMLVVLLPPRWFGEVSLCDGGPRTHDVWADAPSTLLHMPEAAVRPLLDADPRHWRAIGVLIAQKLRTAFDAIEDSALLSTSARLARHLLAISDGFGDHADPTTRTVRVPQEQLAAMLSLSRQTVNQLLKQLAAQGAVRPTRGGTEIVDVALLRRLAR